MADSIYKWSLTAAANDAADSQINWRENQLPDTVNDSNRAMMMRIAEFREDLTGGIVTTGTSPAYLLTTRAAFDNLADGRWFTARVHATNVAGAATLNVNALGAKAIRKFGTSGDVPLAIGDLQLGGLYQFMYSAAANAGAGGWVIGNPSSGPSGSFAAGTQTLFFNATAPLGWTKQTTHNDKALRIVSGAGGASGGLTAFTTVLAARTTPVTGATTLTTAMIPAHSHTQQGTFTTGTVSANHTHTQAGTFGSGGRTAAHTHSFTNYGGGTASGNVRAEGTSAVANPVTTAESADHAHNTTISGQTGTFSANHTHAVTISGETQTDGGTGGSHTHPGAAMDFAIQYVDAIICQKD